MKALKYIGGLIIAIVLVTSVRVILKELFQKSPLSNSNTINNQLNSEKPWITWVYSGIKISTPEKLSENEYNMSEYEKSIASKIGSYLFESREIVIMVHYLKYISSKIEYDFEYGLKTAISNGVNGLGGKNLTFSTADASYENQKIGEGTFQLGSQIMEYKELAYFNGKNEIALVLIVGPQCDQTRQLIFKIISSIEYSF